MVDRPRALSRGPWWNARGEESSGGGRPAAAARHWRRLELAVAAVRGARRRGKGTSGCGEARRTQWRAHLREMTTAKRSPTAAGFGGGGANSVR